MIKSLKLKIYILFLIKHHTVSHHNQKPRQDRDKRFWFDVSEVSPDDDIMQGELRLYRNLSLSSLSTDWAYTLTVYALSQGEDPEYVKHKWLI